MLITTTMPDTMGGVLRGCIVSLEHKLHDKKCDTKSAEMSWWMAVKEAALLEPRGIELSIVPGYEPIDMFRVIRFGEITMQVGMLLMV